MGLDQVAMAKITAPPWDGECRPPEGRYPWVRLAYRDGWCEETGDGSRWDRDDRGRPVLVGGASVDHVGGTLVVGQFAFISFRGDGVAHVVMTSCD